MKVVAFNGSPNKNGNNSIMLRRVLAVLEAEGIETELIQLAEQEIHGCRACGACLKMKNRQCIQVDDNINSYIEKIAAADGILLGSPTQISMMSSKMKAFIERTGTVAKANDDLFKRKVGAAVVTMRHAGGILTFDAINNYFLIGQMIVPGSSYWNIGIGFYPGEVEKDVEGLETMDTLGKNMAWLIKKLNA